LLHYLEKSFLRKLVPKRKFDENFYREIKDLQQIEKYQFLKDYLMMLNYNFENFVVKNSIEKVLNFFINRSKWKGLYKTRDDIIRLNMNFKTIGNENTKVDSRSFNSKVSINETEELRVRFFSYSRC
jgi:hypothetical protein